MARGPFAEAMPYGNAQGDIFNRLLKNRIVMLGTDVNDGATLPVLSSSAVSTPAPGPS